MNMTYIDQLPEAVLKIMNTFEKNGFECYLVGGCVRDLLLDREPDDYDFTTNARPDEMMTIFEKTIPTGSDYGTVTIMIDGTGYEATTYRLDFDYEGRRPKVVKFAKTLKEDLERRDFTINAMAMDINGDIKDYFNGIEDLNKGIIRCVGTTADRFKEDRLRVLRAFRFASRFHFEIDPDIFSAIEEDSDISNLSAERIQVEFNKILLSDRPGIYLKLLYDTGLLVQFLPELTACHGMEQNNPHHDKDVFDHIMATVDHTEPKLELRLAALFHDLGKLDTYVVDERGIGHFYGHHRVSAQMAESVMKRLRYSIKSIDYVTTLVYWHMSRLQEPTPKSMKKLIAKVGVEKMDDLFQLQTADVLAGKPPFDKDLDKITTLKALCETILTEKQPFSRKDLAINGNDLAALGYTGTKIGEQLEWLLEIVLDDPTKNNKDDLIALSQKNR